MTVNYVVDFNNEKNNKNSMANIATSIFNNKNIQLEKKVYAIKGTYIYDNLNIIDRNYRELSISNCDLLILSEPQSNELTEEEFAEFLNDYKMLLNTASKRSIPVVHIITNFKWFGAFNEILNHYSIKIFTTLSIQRTLEIPNKSFVNIKNYVSLSQFINYSNDIYPTILIDLTQAYDKKYHYNLNFKELIEATKEFSNIDIIINDNSHIPEIANENIKIYKESEYRIDQFKKMTYVYFHSNRPYSTHDVDKILFYAANSKVVYTNYNYYINNLLPSITMNLSKNSYNIKILPKKEAFDIINENRNTVLYNNSILNIINDISNLYFNKPYVRYYSLSDTLFQFIEHPYYKAEKGGIEVALELNDYKYDLERTLILPILFLGESMTSYSDSCAKLNRNSEEFIIPSFSQKTKINIDNQKDLSMIVPIHNNGRYLKYKCLNSILRLSCLSNLEILFIDDGSTDEETIRILKDILQEYPSIVYKKFETGSGSASRPRNVGMEMATGKYITFLDPDNEAIEDGYSLLYNELEKNDDVDMIVGDIVREDNIKRNDISYYKKIKRVQTSDIISKPKSLLVKTNLAVQSIQALIVKKEIIKDNGLSMIEGAAGQDTLFFQELLLKCNEVKVINKNIHSYYAYVEGSITNTVTSKFFEKFYKVERERIKFLEKEGLIDYYMDVRFNSYLKNWYIRKYEQVTGQSERKEALKTILKIIDLYSDYRHYMDFKIIDALD